MQKRDENRSTTEELNRSIEEGWVPPINEDMDSKCRELMEKMGIKFDSSPSVSS